MEPGATTTAPTQRTQQQSVATGDPFSKGDNLNSIFSEAGKTPRGEVAQTKREESPKKLDFPEQVGTSRREGRKNPVKFDDDGQKLSPRKQKLHD